MFNSIRSELNNTLQNEMIATLTLMKAILLIYEGILTPSLIEPVLMLNNLFFSH